MKILLFVNQRAACNIDDIRQIVTEIEIRGYSLAVNRDVEPIFAQMIAEGVESYGEDVGEQPQESMMICYGGDGTMLNGIHHLGGRSIPVAGINSGRMGFLTSTSRDKIAELFDAIELGSLTIEQRSMVAAKGDFSNGEWLYGVNEFTIHRHGASMIAVEGSLDGAEIATYHGDGVIVATPTGSTAYSLSGGGPVIAPQCACLVITPLAPHNITMRPLIIPDSSHLTLQIEIRGGEAAITLDDRSYSISSGATVEVCRAERSFYFARFQERTFYHSLRDKMMWGVDLRTKK